MLIESTTPCHDVQRCWWDLNPVRLTVLAAKLVDYNTALQNCHSARVCPSLCCEVKILGKIACDFSMVFKCLEENFFRKSFALSKRSNRFHQEKIRRIIEHVNYSVILQNIIAHTFREH